MSKRLKTYRLEYELDSDKNSNKPLKEYIFKAKNDEHALLIINEFCDLNWAKAFFVSQVTKQIKGA